LSNIYIIIMKTIILAGWSGTRLFPFTSYKSKPFVNILDKPVMEYILENVYDLTDEFFISIRYFKRDFKNYFWDNYKGKKITYINQGKEKWTAAALFNLKNKYFNSKKILIMNWDNIINKDDLKKFVSNIQNYWCIAKFSENPSNHWVLEIWNNKNVLSIIEKPKRFIWNLVNWWVYIVNKEFIKIVKNVKLSIRWEYEITDALNIFMSKVDFSFYELKNKHFDITSSFDIYNTWMIFLKNISKQKLFSKYKHINLNWKNYIWKDCNIWNNVTLNNCLIYDWVKIWDNCVLNNCLIWENTYIWEDFIYNSDRIKVFWPNSFINQK
jgi:bifunctional UDP-N-acetylglucosamine pyrophosphorylase/glucosamine-1-phosphate N-acetyltransferase